MVIELENLHLYETKKSNSPLLSDFVVELSIRHVVVEQMFAVIPKVTQSQSNLFLSNGNFDVSPSSLPILCLRIRDRQ